jgi:hypothetical protein
VFGWREARSGKESTRKDAIQNCIFLEMFYDGDLTNPEEKL